MSYPKIQNSNYNISMKVIIKFFIFSLLLSLTPVHAQYKPDDTVLWSWMRVDGVLDTPEELEFLKDRGVYSIEVQYRLRNNLEDFHQLVLRPMLGYKIDDSRTLWLGYTYVAQDVNGEMVSENRLFQMITYSGKINKTPILFMGATRIEERLLEDKNELAIRLRQLIRISYDVFQINQSTKLGLFFQDEVFIRMNQSWAGQAGYDQNRAIVGLELKTKIKDTPVTFNVGYMNVHTPTRMSHGVNVSVRVNIPTKKKKTPARFEP